MNKRITESQRRKIRSAVRKEIKNKLINERFDAIMAEGRKRESLMIRQGYSQRQINEGIMDWAKGMFKTGAIASSIKRFLAGHLIRQLGLNEKDDPIVFKIIQNVLEAIDYTELGKYFGEDNCPEVLKLVTKATTETVFEFGAEKVIGYLGSKLFSNHTKASATEIADSIQAGLSTVAKESLNDVVVGLIDGILQEPLKKIVCNSSLMHTLSGMKGKEGTLGKWAGFFGLGKAADAASKENPKADVKDAAASTTGASGETEQTADHWASLLGGDIFDDSTEGEDASILGQAANTLKKVAADKLKSNTSVDPYKKDKDDDDDDDDFTTV